MSIIDCDYLPDPPPQPVPSERVAIGEAIEAELGDRRLATLKQNAPVEVENFPPREEGKTRDLAAKAAGFGNGKTYEQAKKVTREAAPELVQAMDEMTRAAERALRAGMDPALIARQLALR